MESEIQDFLRKAKIGALQQHRNMSLYCVLAAQAGSAEFITLDEALGTNSFSISEVSESGSIQELKVTNRSNHKVLLLDGEELVGAKQNRVLSLTVLVGPNSETIIPVSCVEERRWSYQSKFFRSESRAMSAELRRTKAMGVYKNLCSTSSFRSDQGEIWEEIDEKFDRMSPKGSMTRALSDLYKIHEARISDYLNAFAPASNQIGILVLINAQVAGMDLVPNFEKFRAVNRKLVVSYVIDSLEFGDEAEATRKSSLKAKARRFLDSGLNARMEERQSIALGKDLRLESDEVLGCGLELESQVLHLSAFLKHGLSDGAASKVRRQEQCPTMS